MTHPKNNTGYFCSYLILTVAVFTVCSGISFVTDGTAQSRQQVDLEMEYFQVNGQRHITVSLVESEENGQTSMEGVPVELFLGEISEQSKLGSIVTDEVGKGGLTPDEPFEAAADSLLEYTFIARLKYDGRFEETVSQISIRASALNVEAFREEDRNIVRATFTEKLDTGEMSPVEWEELLFEVKRLFGLVAVEEFAFTDEDGEVEIEYPDDIPGDEEGNIVIVVRVPEHPEYGNVEVHQTVAWGVPLVADTDLTELRTWMSKDPPLFIALLFWGAIIVVWGTIGYVVLSVFKIHQSSFKT